MNARPVESSTTTPLRPSRWPALPEILVAACLVALAIFTGIIEGGRDITGQDAATEWWQWLLVVGPSLPVAFRRTAPLVATPISVIAQIIVWGSGLATTFFTPLIMIYTVCAESGERGRKLGIVSCVALSSMTMLGVFVAPDVTIDLFVFTALAVGVSYLLGTQAAERADAEIALAEELAVAQAERDSARERAAANERQRIARELHDIVGHSLSIIAVRAEAADRVAPKNPGAAVDAVKAIATTARSSLTDVRRVLAGLREDDADVDLAPVPSLASLPGLVKSFTEAGLQVSLTGTLPDDALVGAAVGAGTYRIAQEALTNVLKHAGPHAAASVQVDVVGSELVVHIEDNGRGASTTNEHDGLGLAGMQERADVLGGSLRFGGRPGGGYRVVANLPIDSSPIPQQSESTARDH